MRKSCRICQEFGGSPVHGTLFGGTDGEGGDILIYDGSDTKTGSYTKFCTSYECPQGYSIKNSFTQIFLAGSYNKWLTPEIEVFHITNFY